MYVHMYICMYLEWQTNVRWPTRTPERNVYHHQLPDSLSLRLDK